MLNNHVSCTYVVTSVTFYRSSVVDLSRSRSIHAVEHDPCCPDPIKLCGTDCRTVHYGLCSPLLKLPAFSVVRNPSTPSGGCPPSPENCLPPPQSSPVLETFDPVELLAADLEGKLEALVTSFVAQDKVRLAARRGVGDHSLLLRKVNKNNNSRDVAEASSSSDDEKPTKSSNRILRGKTAQKAEELMRALVASQQQSKAKSVSDRYLPLLTSAADNKATTSVQSPPKTSAEYQQAGVKVQINKFASGGPAIIKNETPLLDVPASKSRVVNVAKPSNKTKLQQNAVKSINGQQVHAVGEAKVRWESGPPQEYLQQEPRRKAPSPERTLDGGPTIPHPKLTTVQKQHIRERSLSPTERHFGPVRPFLTKGSVAERVLLFERCPERAPDRSPTTVGKGKTGLTSAVWKALSGDSRAQVLRNKENVEPQTNSLRRLPKTATRSSHNIPRFYYPQGKPQDAASIEDRLKRIATVFKGLTNARATIEQFTEVTKVCGVSLYWKAPLFSAAGGDKKGFVTGDAFLDYWRRVMTSCYDDASRFVRILSRGQRTYLLHEDFLPMIQDIIETHPGLTFLKDAPEFHSRYVHTVIARIFYCVNKSWSGRLTVPELRKSNFLQVLALLEEEEDINQITEYFSYEHFYVIYCKFWELDKDHDLYIDKTDLSRHNDGAISSRMIDRIFSGAVTRGSPAKKGKMSYTEFVWFLMSEEDKRHPRSIEYWFRCMDVDGDGFLSMYELEYFYEEQLHRMEALGIETLPFKDCLCQMLDMIRPKVPGQVSLADLKRCKMTPIFFDTFFNLEKYLDHEQRDPFASQRDHEEGLDVLCDWDRYAAEEYELLVAEESASEHQDEMMFDEYEDGELAAHLEKMSMTTCSRSNPKLRIGSRELDDDDYDYAESDADYHY